MDFTNKHQMVWEILMHPKIGPITYYKLLQKLQSIQAVHSYLKPKKLSLSWKNSISCVGHWQPEYPANLRRLADAPPLLWLLGENKFLQHKYIGIVGGRNASYHGQLFAEKLSEDLMFDNYGVASGLARGIDTAAHRGALKFRTIAVLAGGVDRLYPQENLQLYNEIVNAHLIVSEMPPGTEPLAQLFPRRNRIIAALADALCIVEAAKNSGSLITAHAAAEMGVPVLAMPGSPFDTRCQGCNQLIRDGAHLLENIDDLRQILAFTPFTHAKHNDQETDADSIKPKTTPQPLKIISKKILDSLCQTPISTEKLVKHLAYEFSPQEIVTALGELEITNEIIRNQEGISKRLAGF